MIRVLCLSLAMFAISGCKSEQQSTTDPEAAHTGAGTLDGVVSHSSHPTVKKGDKCEGSIVMRGTKKPAKLTISCGDTTVYEGEAELRNNINDANNPDDDIVTVNDTKTSDADKTPGLTLSAQEGKPDGESGVMTVWDVAQGETPAWEIKVAI